MKTAIYIEDGRQQVVLTPETKTEEAVCEALEKRVAQLNIYRGEFYACQGGWTRQREINTSSLYGMPGKPDSLIIVLDDAEENE